ncbi:TIGR00266 family protein [bacterium]|nr:TIGR00266 family protein [bacterium]
MAHQIDYKLVGDDMQAAIITLDPGETVQAESGAMMFMEDGIEATTEMQGGLLGGVKRLVSGESLFVALFTNNGSDRRRVSFAAPYPGKILPVNLAETGTMLCQRDAYLCSAYGIAISVAFTRRLGAGFFGGEGFILQKLTGDGYAFIHAGGTIIKHELAVGESLNVDTGCLVAFQESVDYDIKMVSGIKTALFGGEGIFYARLTGPGTVYMQTLPFSRMANRVISASGFGTKDEVRRGGAGLLGKILDGDR